MRMPLPGILKLRDWPRERGCFLQKKSWRIFSLKMLVRWSSFLKGPPWLAKSNDHLLLRRSINLAWQRWINWSWIRTKWMRLSCAWPQAKAMQNLTNSCWRKLCLRWKKDGQRAHSRLTVWSLVLPCPGGFLYFKEPRLEWSTTSAFLESMIAVNQEQVGCPHDRHFLLLDQALLPFLRAWWQELQPLGKDVWSKKRMPAGASETWALPVLLLQRLQPQAAVRRNLQVEDDAVWSDT